MKLKSALATAAVVLASLSMPAMAQDASGTWLTASGETRVRIAPCGGSLCGTIAWTKASGAKDVNNPNANLKGRNLVGVTMITMKPAGDKKWTGTLYNPQDGKTYSGTLTQTGANSLSLSGCVAAVFCRSQNWTRVN
ncbi:MAG TPA: DUF2147 domain-containing protein [Xanthobacteraceae bacterium]|nr:DUF2147 domain-containing protein [Xanthobacteraceae bacterium]